MRDMRLFRLTGSADVTTYSLDIWLLVEKVVSHAVQKLQVTKPPDAAAV